LELLTGLEPGGEGDIPPPPAVYSSLKPIILPEPLVDVPLCSVRPLKSKQLLNLINNHILSKQFIFTYAW